jgi:hypothetical protein
MFCLQFVFNSKEKWFLKTCDRSKTSESLCSVFSLQNERNRACEVASLTRGLYDLSGSKSSFLSCTFRETSEKILCLRLFREKILLQMFAIWFFSKSEDIYKDSSTYNQNSTKQGYKGCCLPRRYFNIGFFQTRGFITCKIFDFTIRTAWFFYQQRKIIPKTITSSGLFGIPNKFQDNVDETTTTQNKGSNSGMSKNKGKGVDIHSETCIPHRKISATANAVFSARLQTRALLRDKNAGLKKQGWDSTVKLSNESLMQLDWWIQNLHLWNGKSLIPEEPTTTIFTDASTSG